MKHSIFISAFFLLLFTQQLHAQLTWTAIPFDGKIEDFALGVDGSIFVAATLSSGTGGIFHSTDSGSSWTKISDSLGAITCDSNGAVVLYGLNGAYLSRDTCRTWQPFGGQFLLNIGATTNGIYVTYEGGDLNYTNDYGSNWITLAQSAELDDWRGIYCGADDRMIACSNFCACFQLLDSNVAVNDTPAIGNLAPIDNDAPTNIVFGDDGYIYVEDQYGLVRLAAGRGEWEIYDSVQNRISPYLPLASQNARSVIYIDSNGTYSSTNHGDSWHSIGNGLNVAYPFLMEVAFDHQGTGYALPNDTLYTTANIPLSVGAPQPSLPISLYPIPCSTNLTIHASNIEQIKVFDLLGTLRINQQYGDGITNPELDVSRLSAGVYAVEVTTASKTNIVQMVKE